MELLISTVIFLLGIVLVMKGGDIFVDGAVWIAKAAGIPTFIIGATIVSLATTMPEQIVSFLAAAQGKVDMAIGNAVGSVTANTALIMALAFVFMHVVICRKDYLVQGIILIICAALVWLGAFGNCLSNWASCLLILCFIVFLLKNIQQARAHAKNVAEAKETASKKQIVSNVIKFIIGVSMIVGGSQLLINGGSKLAELFGVPERIIAVTFVAIGTSLPELVTTLTAIKKREAALSVGNIIGANIIDLSLILPVCSLISGRKLPISDIIFTLDLPACFAVTLLAVVPLLCRQKATRTQGILLLCSYAAYLYVTF